MSPWRSILIFSLFFVDVRVRAEEPKGEDCWGNKIPCAIHAGERRRELKGKDFTLVLAAHSLFEQSDASTIRLINGEFYAEAKTEMKFKTPYATFWCANECKALVQRRFTEVTLKSLEGRWVVQRLGDKTEYELISGLQVTVSEVQTDGIAHMEFPQSLPWTSTVNEWAKLFSGPKDLFKSEVVRFRQEWKGAVETVSLVHSVEAARVLAGFEANLAKERARRKAIEQEERALRDLFRKKNYIDP